MIDGLTMTYNTDREMIEVNFAIFPGAVEKLHDAVTRGKLKHGHYQTWDGDEKVWFCGYLHVPGNCFEFGASYEDGRIRIAATPTYDRLDHTAPVDLSDQWVQFVRPLKSLMEILR